jgi:hypothetical protein
MVNQGDAAIGNPVYVALYKKKTPQTYAAADLITTGNANIQIFPGDTGTVVVTIPNIAAALPMDGVVVRLNDNGTLFPVQPECDINNNTLSFMLAVSDTAQTVKFKPVTIDVLANDVLNDCLTPTLSIATQPPVSEGSAIVSGNQIIFTPGPSFLGETTFIYQITCGGQVSTATVVVRVKPVYIPVNPNLMDKVKK